MQICFLIIDEISHEQILISQFQEARKNKIWQICIGCWCRDKSMWLNSKHPCSIWIGLTIETHYFVEAFYSQANSSGDEPIFGQIIKFHKFLVANFWSNSVVSASKFACFSLYGKFCLVITLFSVICFGMFLTLSSIQIWVNSNLLFLVIVSFLNYFVFCKD